MLYDDLEKDLLDMMNNKVSISLKSLVNTLYSCEDVETLSNTPFSLYAIEVEKGTREVVYRKDKHYSNMKYLTGFVTSKEGTRIYYANYINVKINETNGYKTIYFTRCDLPRLSASHDLKKI